MALPKFVLLIVSAASFILESLSQPETCLKNQYWDKNDLKCWDCKIKMANCEECINSYSCTKCAPKYHLLNNDNDGTFEACDLCLGKDRYLDPTDDKCYLCRNLIDGCAECDNPKKCVKCRSNPYLYRFILEAETRDKFTCTRDCADAQYKTIDRIDGTGLCQYCTNLVDPLCRNCAPLPTDVPMNRTLYQCTQCWNDPKLKTGSNSNLTLYFAYNATIKTYNVTCGICNITSKIRFSKPGDNSTGGGTNQCTPCDKEWNDCNTCQLYLGKDENKNDVQRWKCDTCKKDRYFNMDRDDENLRECLTCINTEGFSRKVKGLEEGKYQCYACNMCGDCENETRICKFCNEDTKVLMPWNLTCNACDPKSFFQKDKDHCIEVPYITNQTVVVYNETTWTAKLELYCSVYSKVYWVAATNDQAIISWTGEMIRDFLKNKSANFWKNTTRNPDYLMMGTLWTENKTKMAQPSKRVLNNTPTYYALLNLSTEMKANSRYSIIHFCENTFDVMSLFYDMENWTVQDNGSRDLELYLAVSNKAPTSEEKYKVTCEVAKLLGSLTLEDKVISEEGISCAEGKVLFAPKTRRQLQAVYEDDTVIIPPRFLSNITDFFMVVFIEKDYYARSDNSKFETLKKTLSDPAFLQNLQNSLTAANINVTVNASFSSVTVKEPFNSKWEKTAPSVLVNFNESLPLEILNVTVPIANESMMWVEFTPKLMPGLIYFGYEKAPRDLPSPSIENFRLGRNFWGNPLDDFKIINGKVNETYRFMYGGLNKFNPRFYRFFITIGDYYPAPFQSIFPPICHIYDINPPIVVIQAEDDQAKKRDIGLGVGLGLGLPIVACIIFIVIKLLQKMKGQKKEKAKRSSYQDVQERELAQVLDSEKLAESKKLQDD